MSLLFQTNFGLFQTNFDIHQTNFKYLRPIPPEFTMQPRSVKVSGIKQRQFFKEIIQKSDWFPDAERFQFLYLVNLRASLRLKSISCLIAPRYCGKFCPMERLAFASVLLFCKWNEISNGRLKLRFS